MNGSHISDAKKGINYYTLLGINQNANDSEIKAAYRHRSLKWHPDKEINPALKNKREAQFKILNGVHEVLQKSHLRQQYTQELNRAGIILPLVSVFDNLILMEMMLEIGSNIDQMDNVGNTALIHASYRGNIDAVNLLLQAGANPNYVTLGINSTPLSYAAEKGYLNIVHSLLKANANALAKNNHGYSPLYYAVINGHVEIVNKLLEADPRLILNAWPLVIEAIKKDHISILKTLLAHGIEPGTEDQFSVSPYQMTTNIEILNLIDTSLRPKFSHCVIDGDIDQLNRILSIGIRPSFYSEGGNPLLKIARTNQHLPVVTKLINLLTESLVAACKEGNIDEVKKLLQAGAQPNLIDQKGNTALVAASSNGHMDILNILIEKGAPINQPGIDGQTPLHAAIEGKHLAVAQKLLESNADSTLMNLQGLTPHELAKLKGYTDIVYFMDNLISKPSEHSLAQTDQPVVFRQMNYDPSTSPINLSPNSAKLSRHNTELKKRKVQKDTSKDDLNNFVEQIKKIKESEYVEINKKITCFWHYSKLILESKIPPSDIVQSLKGYEIPYTGTVSSLTQLKKFAKIYPTLESVPHTYYDLAESTVIKKVKKLNKLENEKNKKPPAIKLESTPESNPSKISTTPFQTTAMNQQEMHNEVDSLKKNFYY